MAGFASVVFLDLATSEVEGYGNLFHNDSNKALFIAIFHHSSVFCLFFIIGECMSYCSTFQKGDGVSIIIQGHTVVFHGDHQFPPGFD